MDAYLLIAGVLAAGAFIAWLTMRHEDSGIHSNPQSWQNNQNMLNNYGAMPEEHVHPVDEKKQKPDAE